MKSYISNNNSDVNIETSLASNLTNLALQHRKSNIKRTASVDQNLSYGLKHIASGFESFEQVELISTISPFRLPTFESEKDCKSLHAINQRNYTLGSIIVECEFATHNPVTGFLNCLRDDYAQDSS